MRKKKPPENSPDMEIRYLANGTKIMPVVNGQPIYPESAEKAGQFDEILRSLASFDPSLFDGDAADAIKSLIHLARHFCDVYGLNYKEIDRQAHIVYSQDRWLSHAKHEGEKS